MGDYADSFVRPSRPSRVSRLARVSMGGEAAVAGGGFRPVDIEAQKKLNAEAPRIPHLGRRVVALFRPYRFRILITGVLVIAGAAIAVVPALIVQRIFDEALFPVDGGPPDLAAPAAARRSS